MRAMVVFPVPGGPQRMKENLCFFSTATRSGFPAPTRCSCPTASSSFVGRIRAASGSIVPIILFSLICADGGSRTRADCLEGNRHTVRPRPLQKREYHTVFRNDYALAYEHVAA